jgi:catalase-peroxidase
MIRAVSDNNVWFPNRLDISILRQQGANNPEDPNFDYAKAFESLDLTQVKKDIRSALTTSQDWWPADWGHYGPFMIRMAWHMAGTYRVSDGRGGANTGNQRFAPLNSWPDNGNLDKARRLLWPVKQKYGRSLSWADLFMLTGNQAYEMMGLQTFGFGGGRIDIYSSEQDTYWGPETEMEMDERHAKVGDIYNPLGASEMGLIYVNPEGPNGEPDILGAAAEIRATFGNMAMNDYETVALIAGGHTFGKSHGAAPNDHLGPPPEASPMEMQGLGYKNSFGTGKGKDTITNGIEGAWTQKPTTWDNGYFDNLYKYDWELIQGPGGKNQWQPKGNDVEMVPDAHEKGKMHKPMMMTTDIALIEDPVYAPISKHFHENPDELADAFAKAWYKLIHRDMGPVQRLLGVEVPEPQIWQDPIPAVNHALIDEADIENLKSKILASDVTIPELVRTAWASASTFRGTDYRGGANGARIRLAPQKNWEANNPPELNKILKIYEMIQDEFNKSQKGVKSVSMAGAIELGARAAIEQAAKTGHDIKVPGSMHDKRVSMADLIVLGGCAAIEQAAKAAGHNVKVPFRPGRMDASAEDTDEDAFAPLEPEADGFRNYVSNGPKRMRVEEMLVDRAHLLTLTAPEMTVLVGGLRALNANAGGSSDGVLTNKPETLTNDFFVNLLDMSTEWIKLDNNKFEGRNRATGETKWTGTRADLVFGSSSELRAISEYYACDDAESVFVKDFVAAWDKVMNLDRFD